MTGTARRIATWEPAVVALVALPLWFPTLWPAWAVAGLLLLLLVWCTRWVGIGRPGARTPLDLPLLLLGLMILVAVGVSTLPELTLPKLTGLILGLAVFRATVNAGRLPQGLAWATAVFFVLGLGLAMMGVFSTDWAIKVPALEAALLRIPQLFRGLPGAQAGINANELGGAILFFFPVSLAALGVRVGGGWWQRTIKRLGILFCCLFFAAVLILSQSRSAWLGAVVGLAVMAWLRWRWARWLILGAIVVLLLSLLMGSGRIAQELFPAVGYGEAETVVGTLSLSGRIELWSRALYAIQDFPFTGSGLGTFRRVVHVLYPLFLIEPGFDIGHAHNVFLQVALDLGILGLVAYLALVGSTLWFCWQTVRLGDSEQRWLALGLVGSLVAFHVYGLTDTIALGAKPGIALWMILALAELGYSQASSREGHLPVRV